MPETRTIVGRVDYEALFLEGLPAAYTAGTVLGAHSVAELGELLQAKDYEQAQIEAAFARLDKSAISSPVLEDWVRDWEVLKARYQGARIVALAKIEASKANLLLGPSFSDAETEWQLVLHALTLTPGHYQKGDVQDVYNRVVAMGAKVDVSHVPQPSTSNDADLIAFQQLDKIAKALPDMPDPTDPSNLPLVLALGLGAAAVLVLALRR